MGRRGPAPTPTEILKLRGSPLAKKRAKQGESKGPSGRPRCPNWLDAEAKAMWRRLVPQLELMGVLTRIDGNALARYCRLWSRWRKAEEFIDQHGEMYPLKDEKGQTKYFQQWPQVAIANKLAQQLTRLEQEFGMTPSSRTRIQVAPRAKEPSNAKSRFFEAG
jgi:P27 family predicted phage terminase small subunit